MPALLTIGSLLATNDNSLATITAASLVFATTEGPADQPATAGDPPSSAT